MLDLKPGKTINDRWKLLRRIGSGGMGIVWLAHDRKLECDVVIKFPRSDEDTIFRRFDREGKMSAQVHHANVITLLDYGKIEVPFLVFHEAKGVDLQGILTWCKDRGEILSLVDVREIFVQICRGLQSIHHRGIIHRDLTPTNVCVGIDASGKIDVRILDLGIGKMMQASEEDVPITGQEEQPLGTRGYLSPEQESGQELSHKSDLFTLGILLHEMLTGIKAFDGNARFPATTGTANGTPPPPFVDFLKKALHKVPAERFDSASEMAENAAQLWHEPGAHKRRGTEVALESILPLIEEKRAADARRTPVPGERNRSARPPPATPPPLPIVTPMQVPVHPRRSLVVAIGTGIPVFGMGFAVAAAIFRSSSPPVENAGTPANSAISSMASANATSSSNGGPVANASAVPEPSASAAPAPSTSAPQSSANVTPTSSQRKGVTSKASIGKTSHLSPCDENGQQVDFKTKLVVKCNK